jgi:hypothetical protein
VSLFPLLLVFTTVLGYVLQDNAELQHLLHSALVDFPVIGEHWEPDLAGHWYALAISLVISFWGRRVSQATDRVNTVWNVPFINRPSVWGTIRQYGLLAVMSISILAHRAAVGRQALRSLAVATRIGAIAASAVINIGSFMLAFGSRPPGRSSSATSRPRSSPPQLADPARGSVADRHQIHHQQALYGTFQGRARPVAWLTCRRHLALRGRGRCRACRRLWPRSVAPPPLTRRPSRAYRAYAATTMRRPESEVGVDVQFKPQPEDKAMASSLKTSDIATTVAVQEDHRLQGTEATPELLTLIGQRARRDRPACG